MVPCCSVGADAGGLLASPGRDVTYQANASTSSTAAVPARMTRRFLAACDMGALHRDANAEARDGGAPCSSG